VLPWALLVAGTAASLDANVAVAEPTATGRVIAAWPLFSLIAAYELSDAPGPPDRGGNRFAPAFRTVSRIGSACTFGHR